jgi:hypothetical protein
MFWIAKINCRCIKFGRFTGFISLKRGQTHSSKFQGGGGKYKSKEGQPHIKYRESQFPRGEGQINPNGVGGGAPPGPQPWNKPWVYLLPIPNLRGNHPVALSSVHWVTWSGLQNIMLCIHIQYNMHAFLRWHIKRHTHTHIIRFFSSLFSAGGSIGSTLPDYWPHPLILH